MLHTVGCVAPIVLQDMESNSCFGSLSTGQAVQHYQAHERHLPVAMPASLETGSRLLTKEEDQVSRDASRLACLGCSSRRTCICFRRPQLQTTAGIAITPVNLL